MPKGEAVDYDGSSSTHKASRPRKTRTDHSINKNRSLYKEVRITRRSSRLEAARRTHNQLNRRTLTPPSSYSSQVAAPWPAPPTAAKTLILQTRLKHFRAALRAIAARGAVAMHGGLRYVDHPPAVRAVCLKLMDDVREGVYQGVGCGFRVQGCTSRNALVPLYTPCGFRASI